MTLVDKDWVQLLDGRRYLGLDAHGHEQLMKSESVIRNEQLGIVHHIL